MSLLLLHSGTFLKNVPQVGGAILLEHLLDHFDSRCVLLDLSVVHLDRGRAFEVPELLQGVGQVWLLFGFRAAAAWEFLR